MKRQCIRYGWIIGLSCLLISCRPDARTPSSKEIAANETSSKSNSGPDCQLPYGEQTVVIDGIAVDLIMPESKYAGDLLVLPPWNTSRTEWCLHARFCSKATKHGYRLIMPEMGKSIFAQAVYPETRKDWVNFPTMKWLKETLIPDLRNNHCLLKEGGQNFVLGASSGARGAILLAEELPDLFTAVAALSGDYNPSLLKGDNIFRGFLGEYDQFPQRWDIAENVMEGATNIRAAVYLGHGKADNMVSYLQTQALHDRLKSSDKIHLLKLSMPDDRKGDFAYWSSEIGNVLAFFESTQASGPEGALQ